MTTQANIFAAIPTVDAKGFVEFLNMCHAAKRVPMVYGPPGVGKSSIVAQWARDHGMALYDVRLAQLLPEHLAAIQYPDERREHVVRLTPAIVADVHKLHARAQQPVLIFADEITLASSETLSAALEMILDGRVNGFALPAGTWIVAAGNRPQDTASACLLDPPVRSRAASVVYRPSPSDVADYLTRTMPTCPLAAHVARFVTSQQAQSHVTRDEIGDEAAFYTPRGLESAVVMAAPHVKDVTKIGKTKLAKLAFAACVGSAFFAALAAWSEISTTWTDAAAILADPAAAKIPDTQQAVSVQLDVLRNHCVAKSDKAMWQKFTSYMAACTPEHVLTWVLRQPETVIDSIQSSARGVRLLDQIGASQVTSAEARNAKL